MTYTVLYILNKAVGAKPVTGTELLAPAKINFNTPELHLGWALTGSPLQILSCTGKRRAGQVETASYTSSLWTWRQEIYASWPR